MTSAQNMGTLVDTDPETGGGALLRAARRLGWGPFPLPGKDRRMRLISAKIVEEMEQHKP